MTRGACSYVLASLLVAWGCASSAFAKDRKEGEAKPGTPTNGDPKPSANPTAAAEDKPHRFSEAKPSVMVLAEAKGRPGYPGEAKGSEVLTLSNEAYALFARQEYAKAGVLYKKLLDRHSDWESAPSFRNILSACYWGQAVGEYDAMVDPNNLDRTAAGRRYRDLMGKAKAESDATVEMLARVPQQRQLSSYDENALRQSSLRAADARFFLGEFGDAADRYLTLARQRHEQVEEVYVLGQAWYCFARHLNQPAKAADVRDRIKTALSTLKPSDWDGASPDRRKAYWEKWLNDTAK